MIKEQIQFVISGDIQSLTLKSNSVIFQLLVSIRLMYTPVWDLILPFLEAIILVCYFFMSASIRHKTPESETKDLTTRNTASSM